MSKESGENQPNNPSPDSILDDYLDRFARVGDQSAIVVDQTDAELVTSTLDGTRLYFPSQLAEKADLKEKKVTKLLKSGKIKGVMFGDTWLASEEALREYQSSQAKH